MTQRQAMQRIIISYLIILLIPAIFNLFAITQNYVNPVLTLTDIIGAVWLLLLVHHTKETAFLEHHPVKLTYIIFWGIIGALVAIACQLIIIWIECNIFHNFQMSLNTNMLITSIKSFPLMIIAIVLAAPIMEEIVFRKTIFGNLCQFTNKWLAALIASILFALTHADGHLLTYTLIGMIFCYIYQKTNSIYSSMIAHILMNSFVIGSYLITIH